MVNKPSTITLGGIPATVDSSNNWHGKANVTACYSKNDACFGPLLARLAASSSGVELRCRGGLDTREATAASRSATMRSHML